MIHSLTSLPGTNLVEKPDISSAENKILEQYKRYLLKEDNLFNGPALHVSSYSSGKLKLFWADYSWTLARSEGHLSRCTLGQLAVSLALAGPDGFLWQQRSSKVLCPNVWDFSAAGGVDCLDLESAIKQEAAEEIGQTSLPGLQAKRLLVSRRYGVALLFLARWGGEEIVINDEVSAVCWQKKPPGRTTPQCRALVAEGW